MPRIRLKLLPRQVANVCVFSEEVKRPRFALRRHFAVIQNAAAPLAQTLLFHKDVDAHADANPEHVGITGVPFADVTSQIENVKRVKFLGEVLPHPIKRHTVDETMVRDERDDARFAKPIRCPSEGFDVRIIERVFELCRGGSGISVSDTRIHRRILPIAVCCRYRSFALRYTADCR